MHGAVQWSFDIRHLSILDIAMFSPEEMPYIETRLHYEKPTMIMSDTLP
jgi:hypothetical protein